MDLERELRTALGIPPEAKSVLILGQFAHLDWDWQVTFDDYLDRGHGSEPPVTAIYKKAFELLRKSHQENPPYVYATAVIGYLKSFIEANPGELQDFQQQIGGDLRILGGGITSPDNLLPNGEGFIRNYLVGSIWVREVLGLEVSDTCWIPDDFGHDGQLPVVARALGFRSAGFGRCAGDSGQGRPVAGSPAAQLLKDGVDFMWQARDGSTVLGHWMQASYCQGSGIAQFCSGSAARIRSCVEGNISQYVEANRPVASTGYLFVPVGCDFTMPVTVTDDQGNEYDVLDFAQWWNEDRYPNGEPYAVASAFDDFTWLVLATKWTRSREPKAFRPTPYWTGFYASRPALKIHHEKVCRMLTAAETFGVLADSYWTRDPRDWERAVAARDARLFQAWLDLAPSTHHDYITGTAADAVYQDEQEALLEDAEGKAGDLLGGALADIAKRVDGNAPSGSRPIVVANGLGWARSGVVEVPGLAMAAGPSAQPVSGGTLLWGSAPSLGYRKNVVDPSQPLPVEPVKVAVLSDHEVQMGNGLVSLRLTGTRYDGFLDWAISSLKDGRTGLDAVPAGQGANLLRFYDDGGGLYNFGNETFNGQPAVGVFELRSGVELSLQPAVVVENGPLRAVVQTTATATINGTHCTYVREYSLTAGEPWVRVRATGQAPQAQRDEVGMSIGVAFPLARAADRLEYGTTYHWDDAPPEEGWIDPPAWSQPVFQVAHDFVLPVLSGSSGYPFALYQSSLKAVSNNRDDENVLGLLWRNTPADDHRGQSGHDLGTHTHEYALRVPSGLSGPATGQPLRESLQVFSPLAGAPVPMPNPAVLPLERSIASVRSGGVILTAAKAGSRCPEEVVLRVYKPDDASRPTVEVEFNPGVLAAVPPGHNLFVRGITGVEQDLPPQENQDLSIVAGPTGFRFVARYALTSLAVSGPYAGYYGYGSGCG